ncbi:hypothetical protein DVK85_13010 [Flavobacterium arcticum]|uniref:Gliding motility-associated C-terminal domain-containing protein n=1 Tax=Flavobacterium arcticum TaxID=1784713 RepID=A0A345HET9_9FLAO|nr:T9SS type B sorting domain-containing protein [Flavobacterium arcticum]AXG75099.1 hypothetical protein DVK85_13010 [Flavobacterium arcticum]KAF2511122.1 T9SS type B sorting domain-containing protein [Flavobacterium arcticum]
MKNIFRVLLLLILYTTGLYAQSDCPDAIVVCGNHDYYGLDATGVGVQELGENACSSIEHNSIWLKIMIKEGGTLGFTIFPEEIDDLVVDFDFWIFGPNVTCYDLGTTIRCSTTNPLAAVLDYNTTGMNDTQTDVSEGPGMDGNSFIQWMEVEDGDIYYLIIDRPHGASNFSLEWTGSATFHDTPVFNNPNNIPLDIVQCDDDGVNDETTTFDLTVYADMFIDDQTGVALTYHLSENDMVTGENPMESPEVFVNETNPQTIYLKMTDVVTGCYSNETFTISLPPSIGIPQDIIICDNSSGIAEFDLSVNEAVIANGNTNAVVTYYTSEEDAQNAIGAIELPYQNQFAYQSEQIWVRIEDEQEGCIDFTSFIINVAPIPLFNVPDDTLPNITLCDNDGIPDGSVEFDLTINETLLKGDQEDIIFTYYEDIAAGEPELNPIAFPESYSNVPNPQIIHVKIENAITGCYTMGTFMLNVTPGAGIPEELFICDDDDGIATFDLSTNTGLIANGNTDAVVTYYPTQQDAEDEENELDILYENETPYTSEIIWARLDKTEEECVDYTSFTITVITPPEFVAIDNIPPDITLCDNDGVDDELVIFNLTVNEAMLQGTQQNVVFTYYEDNNGIPATTPIATPEMYANNINPQVIHITITNTLAECSTSSSFNLIVIPGAGTPDDLYLCDNDGIAEFDLSINNDAVANGNDNAVISYYTTEEDALNGANAIGELYENTLPYENEQLWARSDVLNGNCFDIASFTIHVTPAPTINNPDGIDINLTKCDDDGIDDAATIFNLTEYSEIFIGNQTDIEITYHLTPEDMASGENTIANPETFTNTTNPQTIYIRLTNTMADCYTGDSFSINIDYTLPTGEPQDLLLCDFEEDGFQLFDLAENSYLISNGNSDTVVTYYTSQEDAENDINPINRFYTNTTPYINQTIWARLENTSGCFGYGVTYFTIGILPLPEIDYTLNIVDFTTSVNAITVIINENPEAYEFSMNGQIFTDVPTFNNLIPGLYTIYIRSKDNCKTIELEVPILNYPKYFTPNGDGTNEVWNVSFLYFFPDARVTIFDRYGKMVKSYLGKQKGWDGTYNGHNLPATDYWFKLEFNNGRVIKSHFSLLR